MAGPWWVALATQGELVTGNPSVSKQSWAGCDRCHHHACWLGYCEWCTSCTLAAPEV